MTCRHDMRAEQTCSPPGMPTPRVGAVAIIAIVAASIATGSCLFASATNVCESGLRCAPGLVCDVAQDACIEIGGCGDGIRDDSKGELCDDGNTKDGDGCSARCDSLEVCGNNHIDAAKGELCDDGNTEDGDGCSSSCRPERCGDKILDPGEACDDGNAISGDGCNADCSSNEACGNGVVDNYGPGSAIQEDCDPEPRFPLPAVDTATCNSDCKFARCGDGRTNPLFRVPDSNGGHLEECDDGDGAPTDSAGCNIDCTFAHCGDGYRNAIAGEECDNGADNSNQTKDACRTDCHPARCGDHVVDSGETCDDGNGKDDDGCPDGASERCHPATCGDGITRTEGPNPEECDDGNNSNNDSCVTGCKNATCGDGFTRTQGSNPEDCDDGNNSDSDFCVAGCKMATCGDGFKRTQGPDPEECDPPFGCAGAGATCNTATCKCI